MDILLYGAFRDFSGVSVGWVAGLIEIVTNSAQLGLELGNNSAKLTLKLTKIFTENNYSGVPLLFPVGELLDKLET